MAFYILQQGLRASLGCRIVLKVDVQPVLAGIDGWFVVVPLSGSWCSPTLPSVSVKGIVWMSNMAVILNTLL